MVDLRSTEPVDEEDPRNRGWLARLQGNILRGHGRDHGVYIFFSFNGTPDAARQTVRQLAERFVTSARQQHEDTLVYRKTRLPGPLFGSLFLTASGYRHLGFDPDARFVEPPDEAPHPRDPSVTFLEGMRPAVPELGDPPVRSWEDGYQHELHAMLLLADDDEAHLSRTALPVVRDLASIHAVHACERGTALRDDNGEGIEHFGYIDGRSQPLYLLDDFRTNGVFARPRRVAERDGSSIAQWDPFEPLERVLLPDPFAPDEDCFGSFLVFRKLEQDVRGFVARERELADRLGLTETDRELAGALIIGRFRDGTPLVLSRTGGWHPVEDNDFTYDQDRRGLRCPLHAHIRKVNPRGDSLGASLDDRRRRITRRSITYGSSRPAISQPLEALPSEGSGVLFMCFQASIRRQFAYVQRRWCNDMHFMESNAGIDPLIGQGEDAGHPQAWRARYNHPAATPFDFHGFVRMKGGEFFFAPSLPFLRSL